MLSSLRPCLNACSATTSLLINASNFVQRYFSMPYLRKLSLHSVVSRILQKRKGHPGDGCRPRHSRRPNARRESICTGSCDARILARAQMFVQVENRTYFRYFRHERNVRWQDGRAAVLHSHMQKAASPSKRRCGLSSCGNPASSPNDITDVAPRRARRVPNRPSYLHSAQITSPGLGASMPGPLGNI